MPARSATIFRRRFGAGVVASVLVALGSCRGNVEREPVEHFRVVVPGKLSAGARVNERGLLWLRGRGVRTILNLERELLETVPGEVKKERSRAQIVGLSFVHFPLHPVAAPTIAQLEGAVRIIVKSDGQAFVHCDHGDDRTGIVIAAYRIKAQGWSVDRAYKEMIEGGFHSRLYFWWKNRLEEFAKLVTPTQGRSLRETEDRFGSD